MFASLSSLQLLESKLVIKCRSLRVRVSMKWTLLLVWNKYVSVYIESEYSLRMKCCLLLVNVCAKLILYKNAISFVPLGKEFKMFVLGMLTIQTFGKEIVTTIILVFSSPHFPTCQYVIVSRYALLCLFFFF